MTTNLIQVKKKALLLSFITCICTLFYYKMNAQTQQTVQPALTPKAALLFGKTKTKYTNKGKNRMAEAACKNYRISSSGKSFKGANGETVSLTLYPLDLNKDGVEEIFIEQHSSIEDGIELYTADINGFRSILSVSGRLPNIVGNAEAKSWPQMIVGGAGCFPAIWGYNGKEYVVVKESGAYDDCNEESRKKMNLTNAEELSVQYTATIK